MRQGGGRCTYRQAMPAQWPILAIEGNHVQALHKGEFLETAAHVLDNACSVGECFDRSLLDEVVRHFHFVDAHRYVARGLVTFAECEGIIGGWPD